MKRCCCFIVILIVGFAGLLAAGSPPSRTASPAGTPAPIDPEKEQLIRAVMKASHTSELADEMISQTISAMKTAVHGVPDEFWTKFQKKLDPQRLQNQMVAIYDRHFTKDDLRAILDFYQTKAGERLIAEMPGVLQEAMQAGQAWGREIGQEVVREIEAQGYLKKRPSPSPGS